MSRPFKFAELLLDVDDETIWEWSASALPSRDDAVIGPWRAGDIGVARTPFKADGAAAEEPAK